MSDHHHGIGQFGEHSGPAKSFILPGSWCHDHVDPYQKMLWQLHIYVDVREISYDPVAKRNQLRVIGSEADIILARAHCKTLVPPLDIVALPPTYKRPNA
jgi:hypothetical protein